MSTHTLNYFVAPERERQLIAEMERHDRTLKAMRSQVTPAIAANAARTASQYPTVDREVIAAASLAGVPSDHPMLLEVAMRSWEKDQQLWDVAYTALKGVTRVAGTIAQSFYEELISRPLRTVVGALQGISNPYGEAGSSVGVRALGELGAGRRVNLGSGFLPGNDVADPDDQNVINLVQAGVPEAEAIVIVQGQYGAPIWDQYIADSERIKFRGMPVSPGRLAAGVFALEPGSLPYNVFSGTIDAITQVSLDPISKVFIGFKIPRFLPRVGGQFVRVGGKELKGISNVRRDMKKFAGISPQGTVRDSVYKPSLLGFLDDTRGQLLFDALWEHSDDPVALGKIFSNAGKANPPSKLIDAIGRAPDRAALGPIMRGETQITLGGVLQEGGASLTDLGTGIGVADVAAAIPRVPVAGRVGGAVGQRLGPALSGVLEPLGGARVSPELGRVLGFKATVGHNIEGTRLGRLFNTMPGRQLDFLNLDDGARTLDDWMVEAKFDYDKRTEILRKWHELNQPGTGTVQSNFYDLVLGDVAKEFAHQITRDIVPKAVVARGKEAVAAWKVGTKGGLGPEETRMVKLFEQGVTEWFDGMDDVRRYFTAQAGDVAFPGSRHRILGNGDIIEQPTAHLLAEYLNRGFSLPEAREVRRAVSEISWMVTNEALELRTIPGLFDTYMQKIWKPLVLLRVAFPIRVQADNQARMAVSSLDSVFRHPLDWLSWMIADPSDGSIATILKAAARNVPEVKPGGKWKLGRSPRGGTGIVARDIKDEFGRTTEVFSPIMAAPEAKAAMTHSGSSILGYNPGIENPGDVVYTLLHNSPIGANAPSGFIQAWVSEVLQLSKDKIAPRVARGKNEAKEWFWRSSEGRKLRHALADTDKKKVYIDDAAARAEGYANAKAASDTYIESVWARIHEKAGGRIKWHRDPDGRVTYTSISDGNTEIVDAIGSGRLRVDGNDLDLLTIGDARFTRLAKHFTDEFYDEWGPTSIKIHDTSKVQGNLTSGWDRQVKRMFEALASKPENLLSRSPAFRQFYWSRVEEMMPFMDKAARAQTLKAAKAANLDRAALARFAKAEIESTVAVRSITSLEQVENIAMTWALDNTRELLYDLHKRSNFMDIARNIFPFGEAWVEIITRWSKLVYDHPETLRRFQQLVEGGRRSGFVTTDPISGEEVFNYPGGGLLANWMLAGAGRTGPVLGALAGGAALGAVGGIPGAIVGTVGGAAAGAFAAGAAAGEPEGGAGASIALQGQVQGINLVAASYLPGLGPVIQAPLAWLMGTEWAMGKTQFSWLRDQMFPFGAPPINSISDLGKLAMPAWSKKILTPLATGDPDFARLHAHSTIDVMRLLLQTPGYSKDTPGQMLALNRDAKKIATNLSIIRGFLQFGLPTGPSIRFYAAAKGENPETNGKFYLFQTLASEYRKMLEARNFDDVGAFDDFQARFGLDPVDFITSKTTAAIKRGTTTNAFEFEVTHTETFKKYPLTAYYAGPDDPNDEFDLRAWARQLDKGTREEFTPVQWLAARNHTIGSTAYEEAKRKIQARRLERGEKDLTAYNSTERQYLHDMKIWLKGQYPGYNVNNVGTPTKGSIEQQITELQTWDRSPVLSETGAGKAVALYLAARQQVIDRVVARGNSPLAFQRANLDGNGERYRQFLRNYADWLMNQPEFADFGPVWLSVFSAELDDDTDITDLTVAA